MSSEAEQCHGADDDQDSGGLPEDQMFEMLTCVSLDDLSACRQVSAQWRRLTYEPSFSPLHCRRHADAVVSGYFVQGMARNRYSATFVSMHPSQSHSRADTPVSHDFSPSAHVRVEAMSAHRGLACCVDVERTGGKASSARCYYVCKPATRQWRPLPNPRLRFPTAATAMVARPASAGAAADFQILRLSIPTLRDHLRCEIFDSWRWAWRRSSDVMVWLESLVAASPAVRAQGAMHWLRWPDRVNPAEDIFAFDMKSEAWRLIALLPEVEDRADRWAPKKLVTVEGKLCLVVIVEEEEAAEVWVIADYDRQQERWEKKMAVNLKNLEMQEGRALILSDLCSSEVAFFNSVYKVIWYDLRRGKIAEVPVHHKYIQEVFKNESDLVPWDNDAHKI